MKISKRIGDPKHLCSRPTGELNGSDKPSVALTRALTELYTLYIACNSLQFKPIISQAVHNLSCLIESKHFLKSTYATYRRPPGLIICFEIMDWRTNVLSAVGKLNLIHLVNTMVYILLHMSSTDIPLLFSESLTFPFLIQCNNSSMVQ
jgi:hypothetical protein